jgi:RNA polymerase sigma-70 factor (ECF subfamily)
VDTSSAPPQPPPADPRRWFAEEVHAHDGQLKSYLKSAFPSVRDVEDVVQESYLRIWKARTHRKIECARAFLFTIAKRLALDHIRRARNSPFSEVRDLDASGVVEERDSIYAAMTEQEKVRLLAEAIASLPIRMRNVIILHKVEGLRQSEVQAQLGFSPKTVENLALRGIRRIRDFFHARGIEHYRE